MGKGADMAAYMGAGEQKMRSLPPPQVAMKKSGGRGGGRGETGIPHGCGAR